MDYGINFFVGQYGKNTFSCDDTRKRNLPRIILYFNSYENKEFNLTLPWKTYVEELKENYCYLRVEPYEEAFVVGTHFLKYFYTSYHASTQRIGIVPSKELKPDTPTGLTKLQLMAMIFGGTILVIFILVWIICCIKRRRSAINFVKRKSVRVSISDATSATGASRQSGFSSKKSLTNSKKYKPGGRSWIA